MLLNAILECYTNYDPLYTDYNYDSGNLADFHNEILSLLESGVISDTKLYISAPFQRWIAGRSSLRVREFDRQITQLEESTKSYVSTSANILSYSQDDINDFNKRVCLQLAAQYSLIVCKALNLREFDWCAQLQTTHNRLVHARMLHKEAGNLLRQRRDEEREARNTEEQRAT